jgi:hypothetical protein
MITGRRAGHRHGSRNGHLSRPRHPKHVGGVVGAEQIARAGRRTLRVAGVVSTRRQRTEPSRRSHAPLPPIIAAARAELTTRKRHMRRSPASSVGQFRPGRRGG